MCQFDRFPANLKNVLIGNIASCHRQKALVQYVAEEMPATAGSFVAKSRNSGVREGIVEI